VGHIVRLEETREELGGGERVDVGRFGASADLHALLGPDACDLPPECMVHVIDAHRPIAFRLPDLVPDDDAEFLLWERGQAGVGDASVGLPTRGKRRGRRSRNSRCVLHALGLSLTKVD
jgi:hypothetical protein